LSALIVERHSAGSQRLEDISYVNFGATCDTYMEVWYMKVDKLFHKLENPFARCWNSRDVGAFIKSVHY
jgi:hypothetical protein